MIKPHRIKQTRYYISAMDCPTEEQIIRNGLKGHLGVESLDFDLIHRVLTVTGSSEGVAQALNSLGMAGQVVESAENINKAQEETKKGQKLKWILLGISGVLAASAEILEWAMPGHREGANATSGPNYLVVGLVIAALILGGRDTFRKAWVSLKTFTLNINFLMALAVVGAICVGQWPEAAMVTVLFALAEQIESYSLDRARGAIASLVEITPETARVWHFHLGEEGINSAHWHEMLVGEVASGTKIQVRPGERIPLDGTVLSGSSAVNQAAITGESMPIEKQMGSTVFAGTLNGRGVLEIEVTAAKGNTTLDKIAQAVRDAQSQKAPTQRFVDQFAKIYTPSVVVLALLMAIIPPLFVGHWSEWLYKALVLLVIACPCALVISTPITVVSGLAAAAQQGILIKGGAYLEGGSRLKTIALDKTGTLTNGRPVVTDVVPLGDGSPEYLLHLAASLDAGSEHPVASAIVASCAKGHVCKLTPVVDFEALVGRGVTGILDGRRYYVGNHRLTHDNEVCGPHVEEILERLESEGKTPVILTDEAQALAVLGVADTLRTTSQEAITQLHALGIKTLMLSGDNQKTAEAMAQKLGIDHAQGEMLPEDKRTKIEKLLSEQGSDSIGMVGDGINDAPALALASIGFAMGAAGTDTAIETADVALMHDDLRKLPLFLRLSRKTRQILIQNIAIALILKVIVLALDLTGHPSLWLAVFADMGASLLVIANGLRMLRPLR